MKPGRDESESVDVSPRGLTQGESRDALIKYAFRVALRLTTWMIAGIGLAWVAIWLKMKAETGGDQSFIEWIGSDLWGVWSVNGEDIGLTWHSLIQTMGRVVPALGLSGVLGLVAGWKTADRIHARAWDFSDLTLAIAGSIPLFFLCFIVLNSFQGYWDPVVESRGLWLKNAMAVIILAWGDGNASVLLRTFRQHFARLRSAPYIVAAGARGLSIAGRVRRDSTGVLIESLASRIAVMLGGAAIVEYVLELRDGIGYAVIRQYTGNPSYSAMAAQAVGLVTVVALFRTVDSVVREWTSKAGALNA